jgi:MFS family permease
MGAILQGRYFYGYNIVAAGFITQAVVIGAMFTYGVFFKELEAAFGWSRTLVSGASSVAFLCMGIGGVIAGTLNDRIGPRIILTFSSIALGLGYILMSQMAAPWQLYLLYGLLVGIGFATHDVITLSTVARWYIRCRGMMTGLVKVGTGAGQLVIPVVAAALIARVGWRSAYLLIGIFALTLLVAVAQLMKRDPQGLGLYPDGDQPVAATSGPKADISSLTVSAAARTLTFWSLCLAEFMIFGCLLTTIVHIVPHAHDLGLQPTTAAAVLSTIGGISMLGRIVMGTAIDSIGGKRALVISLTLLILSLVWLQVAANAWMLFTFAVMYGFAHGALFTVMSPTVAEFFGTASHGLIFGLVLFSGTLGGSLGPLLAGYIFDLSGAYGAAFITLTVMACIGLFLAILIRPVKTENITPGS